MLTDAYVVAKAARDPNDYTDKFNTALSPVDEAVFWKWATENNKVRDLYDYDLRGAWLEQQKHGNQADSRGHYPDTFKKPNHITFSRGSRYSNAAHPGGEWGEKDGVPFFKPSAYTVQMHGVGKLYEYMKAVEPGVVLDLAKENKRGR